LWCGKLVDERNRNREHIFPRSIGGKKTLSLGSVCMDCNSKLSFLDRVLTRENPAIMDAFQADPDIKGYKRKGKDKEEKTRRKIFVKGEGEAKHTRISREKLPDVNLVNANFRVTSEKFVRALHKCTANILCDYYGSTFTRRKFVVTPKTAYLLTKLSEDEHLPVPDPSKDDTIRVYYKKKKSGKYDEKDYFPWERPFMNKMVNCEWVRKNQRKLIMDLDFYQFAELIDIKPELGCQVIHSMSEPFSEEDIEDEVMHNWINHFKMQFHQLHLQDT
jgi:HNH endonuclease